MHREVEAVPSSRELPFMTIVKDAGAALKSPVVVTPTFAGASLAPLRFRKRRSVGSTDERAAVISKHLVIRARSADLIALILRMTAERVTYVENTTR